MRTMTAAQAQVWASKFAVHLRAWIKDAGGTWVNLSALDGRDWLSGASIESDIDSPVDGATITLHRDAHYLSLAPTMAGSKLNLLTGSYSPLIDTGREVKIEAAIVPIGIEPAAGDWMNIFQGRTDDPEWGGFDFSLPCRDLGSDLQESAFIEEEREYGADDGSVLLEDVIQSILTDNGTGVTLYVPVASAFAIRPYRQQEEPCMNALQTLALQRGWDCRYKWDSGTSAWRLTLYGPDRTKVVPDLTFGPDKYFDIKALRVSRVNVRNVVKIGYLDPADGEYHYVTREDAASIAKYGRKYTKITEASTSQIDTQAEAEDMADACLADLKDPKATLEAELPFFPWVELSDLYRFSANGVHFDSDQDLAVVSYRHDLTDPARPRTHLTLRGTPAGAYKKWFDVLVWPGWTHQGARFPATPTGVSLSTEPDDTGLLVWAAIIATWTANIEKDIHHYQIRARRAVGAGWSEYTYYTSTEPTIRISGLMTGTAYQLEVQAFNTAGYASGWSATETITTAEDTTLPADVTGLADFYERGILMLTWDAIVDAREIKYEIRKGASWAAGTVLDQVTTTKFICQGSGTYWIAATVRGLYSANPASIAIASANMVKNYICAYDEKASGWSGALGPGMVVVDGDLWMAGAGAFDDIPDFDAVPGLDIYGGVPESGDYMIPASHLVNIGRASRCGIAAERTLDSDPATTGAEIQINLAGNNDVYAGWGAYAAGDYIGKKFNLRLHLTSDGSTIVKVSAFNYSIDVPDLFDSARNVPIVAGGTTILFAQAFHAPPSIQITILDAQQGDYVDVPQAYVTTSSFVVRIWNSGLAVSRVINWLAQGY